MKHQLLKLIFCSAAMFIWHMHHAVAAQQAFVTDDSKQPYFAFTIDQDQLSGAPDVSYLNQPLTAADRMVVHNGHFYRVGADLAAGTQDDERIRLYGINLSFSTNFPNKQDATRIARRLRKLGFNAVRLHHMDTDPGMQQNPPRSILSPEPYPSFNETAVSRLHHFIRVLGQEGIYVNLNLEVGYRFPATINGLPTYEGNADNKTYAAPVHVYYPRMITMQEQFAREILRKLELRDYPGLAMVEISNESSLLAAWQKRRWKAAVPPNYEATLHTLWNDWLIRRYQRVDLACKAWGNCPLIDGKVPLMTPNDMNYAPAGIVDNLRNQMRKVVQKLSNATTSGDTPTERRRQDFVRFLADTDKTYFNRIRKVVQAETSTQMPVTGTQMGYGGIMNLDSHADMDYIDEHFYIDHPQFPGKPWDRFDWRFRDSPVNAEELRKLLALSLHRDQRKPYVISEFNQPFPNRQGAVIQPLMAAVAALQDWDGLFFFDYMHGNSWADTPAGFTLSGDWGKFALTAQSALLYRQGILPPLKDHIAIPVPAATRVAVTAHNQWLGYEKHLQQAQNIMPELAMRARLTIDTQASSIRKEITTGNLPWHTPDNTFSLDARDILFLRTATAAGIFGAMPNEVVNINNSLSVRYLGEHRRVINLLVSTLDQKTIPQSGHMLVTLSGGLTVTQPGSLPARPKAIVPYKQDTKWWTLEPDAGHTGYPSGTRDSTSGPVWMEQTELVLYVSGLTGKPVIYPLDSKGQRLPRLPDDRVTLQANNTYALHLQGTPEQSSLWYEIVRPFSPGSTR